MECNIVVLGKLGVGKSAFVVRLLTKKYISEYHPAIEGTYRKHVTYDGKDLTVNLADTNSSDMKDILKWIAWADIAYFLYSVVDDSSLRFVQTVLQQTVDTSHMQQNTDKKYPSYHLIGNKNDLHGKPYTGRLVSSKAHSQQTAQRTAKIFSCDWTVLSVKEDPDMLERLFRKSIETFVKTRPIPSKIRFRRASFRRTTSEKNMKTSQKLLSLKMNSMTNLFQS